MNELTNEEAKRVIDLVESIGINRVCNTLARGRYGEFVSDLEALKKQVAATDMVIEQPPYYEDVERCGYCQREPGAKHEVWCRQ